MHRLWAYKDYNPETGAFCEQDSKFEANVGLEYNNNQTTCGDLSKTITNTTTWQDIGGTVLDFQPSCCDSESRYSADTSVALLNMFKYGYPTVSLLGWVVFLLALWSKKIVGHKDAENENVAHEMQDIPPNAVATLPNDDANDNIAPGMQDTPPNAVATLSNDVEAQPTDASAPHHNEKRFEKRAYPLLYKYQGILDVPCNRCALQCNVDHESLC